MSAPVLRWAAPSITRLVIAWLVPRYGAGNVGARRPQAGQLPYRMVTLVAGNDPHQKVKRSGTVSVHTFADNYDDAEAGAQDTDDRMLLLGPPLAAPQQVTVTNADKSTSVVASATITSHQIPMWLDYQDDLIFRFIARYDIDVRFVANP